MSKSNTIDGYTAEEWCNNDNLQLVIEKELENGNIQENVYNEHKELDESISELVCSWPPNPSGDNWYIKEN